MFRHVPHPYDLLWGWGWNICTRKLDIGSQLPPHLGYSIHTTTTVILIIPQLLTPPPFHIPALVPANPWVEHQTKAMSVYSAPATGNRNHEFLSAIQQRDRLIVNLSLEKVQMQDR